MWWLMPCSWPMSLSLFVCVGVLTVSLYCCCLFPPPLFFVLFQTLFQTRWAADGARVGCGDTLCPRLVGGRVTSSSSSAIKV